MAWFKIVYFEVKVCQMIKYIFPKFPATSQAFIDTVSTFLFLALINKTKKGPANLLTQRDTNEKLFNIIQNEIGAAENVLFWSNNQNLIMSNDFRRLQLSSKYGTGRSLSNFITLLVSVLFIMK